MKRIFDFSISLVLLIIGSPVLIFIALAVYFSMGRPIFFKQKRPGKNCKLFTLIKFRTMKVISNTYCDQSSDKDRITKIGSFLRRTSLDELPELLNVLSGEMSLVGPRPLLPEYLEKYDKEQIKRQTVRPGITGWAQINGRNSIEWEEKFKLDLWYIENQSFFLDLKIIFKTFKIVFTQRGVNQNNKLSMEKFNGNSN